MIICARPRERRSPEACFIAFLDDDDLWHKDYLESCVNALKDETDFVISGLIYNQNGNQKELKIPKKLDQKSFLFKNPHIQGSNTFIRLSTLLKAGCFDENLHSMTDRDFFTRVMMLEPKYVVLNRHLVEINADTTRERLTTDIDTKRESMAKFYAKYGGLMGDKESQFFKNANERFKLELKIDDVYEILKSKPFKYKSPKSHAQILKNRVVFAFVLSDFEYAKRIIENIKR